VLTAWPPANSTAKRSPRRSRTPALRRRSAIAKVVIPGHVAVLMGELEEELPGLADQGGPARGGGSAAVLEDGVVRLEAGNCSEFPATSQMPR